MATVLITGASTGFGEVTALHLARKGHTVVATTEPIEVGEIVSDPNQGPLMGSLEDQLG